MNEFLKNFGMVIPHKAIDLLEKPDPNGVPIYAKCPANGGLCACTGACRRILGYDTNPEKVAAYLADIERRNILLKERMNKLHSGEIKDSGEGKIRIWSWDNKQ